MKLKEAIHGERIGFYCPGCESMHWFRAKSEHFPEGWDFDGDLELPTVQPSILVTWGDSQPIRRCHLYLERGQLKFLSDCTHELAGQTVPLPDIPEGWL